MTESIENIWTFGMCVAFAITFAIAHMPHMTVRKVNWIGSFLFPPQLCWINALFFSKTVWLSAIGMFVIPAICTFLSYKLNRGGADISRDEYNGITAATWKGRAVQQKEWDRMTPSEREKWRVAYQKEKPPLIALPILFAVNFIPYLAVQILLRS